MQMRMYIYITAVLLTLFSQVAAADVLPARERLQKAADVSRNLSLKAVHEEPERVRRSCLALVNPETREETLETVMEKVRSIQIKNQ